MGQYTPPFHSMVPYYPEDVKQGQWTIEQFEVTEEAARFQKMRGMFGGNHTEWYDFKAGKYVRLINNRRVIMMSDTAMEMRTNLEFVRQAHGDVLIAGLGIGMLIPPLLDKPNVTSITIVEIDPDIMTLVDARNRFDNLPFPDRLTIVEGDILTWEPPKGQKWDVIWQDIWPNISADNHGEMKRLVMKYRNKLNRDGNEWLSCWRKDDTYRLAAEERRYSY